MYSYEVSYTLENCDDYTQVLEDLENLSDFRIKRFENHQTLIQINSTEQLSFKYIAQVVNRVLAKYATKTYVHVACISGSKDFCWSKDRKK